MVRRNGSGLLRLNAVASDSEDTFELTLVQVVASGASRPRGDARRHYDSLTQRDSMGEATRRWWSKLGGIQVFGS